MTAALVGAAAVAGLALAPLLDRIASRLPRSPVQHPIPARRLVLALSASALSAATAGRFTLSWALPAYVVLALGLVVLSVIDVERFLLPNVVVYPLAVVTLVLLAVATVGDDRRGALARALAAAAAAWATFAVLHVVAPDGLAGGDVKLAAILGLGSGWLGWSEVVLGFFLAFLVAAAVAGGLVLTRRRTRRDPVPLGPFLAAGTLVAILAGDGLLHWYTGT